MITVEEAEEIILAQLRDYGIELIPFELAVGRVLAEDLCADRDLPPFNRVTMDGIAVNFKSVEKGNLTFRIKGTQAAGDEPTVTNDINECVEIMTGAALSSSVDTVVRYEDLEIKDGIATLLTNDVVRGQSIHNKGIDKKHGDVMVAAGQVVSPAIIGIAASVGKGLLSVRKLPKVVIISSGDELVDVDEEPSAYQIRKSNGYTIRTVLKQRGIHAAMIHIPDDAEITRQQIIKSLSEYDVILLSGGVSMGKFDYIPKALEAAGVKKLFHKVQQRPGKPFWFGRNDNGVLVFAFPGNPVATFMCLQRYFLFWLDAVMGTRNAKQYAMLSDNFMFQPQLKYFLQVKLSVNEQAQQLATPIEGNGSGDFANLADTDAFMELLLERNEFNKGEVFRIWPFTR